MPQYIVLQPISPEQGSLILPARPSREAPDVAPPPVIVDETVISDEAAPILIAAGVLALVPEPAPEAAPELLLGSSDEPAPPRKRKP